VRAHRRRQNEPFGKNVLKKDGGYFGSATVRKLVVPGFKDVANLEGKPTKP